MTSQNTPASSDQVRSGFLRITLAIAVATHCSSSILLTTGRSWSFISLRSFSVRTLDAIAITKPTESSVVVIASIKIYCELTNNLVKCNVDVHVVDRGKTFVAIDIIAIEIKAVCSAR